MAKDNERVTEAALKAEFEKGRRLGRLEGMLQYQKRLMDNMSKDNEAINEQIKKMKG